MPDLISIIAAVLFVLNLISFVFYAYDKSAARKNKRRIRERTLLLVAFVGSAGAFSGMYLLRHKTKHLKFRILVPLFLVLKIVVFVFLSFKFTNIIF